MVKNKRIITITLLVVVIFIALFVYFCQGEPPCGSTVETEENKTENSLPELLDELTPKNASPLTTEEVANLEKLKEELTP
jgi:hypothetical protein